MNTKIDELIFDKWLEVLDCLMIARMGLCMSINISAARPEVERWKQVIDGLIRGRDRLEQYILNSAPEATEGVIQGWMIGHGWPLKVYLSQSAWPIEPR